MIPSEDGEHDLILDVKRITVVGGYLEYCLMNAIGHAIENQPKKNLIFDIYLPGVFSNNESELLKIPKLKTPMEKIWPHPVNPGFFHLERQVGVLSACPDRRYIHNFFYNTGGNFEKFSYAEISRNHTIQILCNGKKTGEIQSQKGHAATWTLNFITQRP